MNETTQLSSLIEDVYDAALDPALWMAVVKKTSEFVGGFSASVVMGDQANLSADLLCSFGGDPYFDRLYDENYRLSDPRRGLTSFFRVGEVFSTAAIPIAEFRKTAFYQEIVQPQGIGDNFMCVLERSPTSYAAFGLLCHKDNEPADHLFRRMQLLMPHMRRAISIGKSVNMGHADAATFINMLDGLQAGIFLLDAKQRVVHANRSGQAMLAEGVLLRNASGRLIANEPNARRTLDHGIAMAAKAGPANGEGLAIPLEARDKDRYAAHLLPLTSGARWRAGEMYGAVAALFVHKAALEAPSSSRILAKHYQLTPTELRVLLAIVEEGNVPEVAKMLGIARSTVKTHLHRLFAKTNTTRQVELVKLVAGFSNPLVG
jgi:DNA-binding CsgD family transcriptional regulator